MKKGLVISIIVLIVLIVISIVMLRSSAPDAPNEQDPFIEETDNTPSVDEQPSLSSDTDVFNEFDSAIDGLS